MKEEKTVGKSIGNALIVILALVIVVELICCGLIYFVFNGENTGPSATTEQTSLKVSQPDKKERKLEDSISVTAEGYVKKQKKKTETKKTESREEKIEEKAAAGIS